MEIFMFSSLFVTNKELNQEIIQRCGAKKKVAFIPSETEFDDGCYDGTITRLKNMGFKDVMIFEIGYEYDKTKEKELFDCDAILIGGGDTFTLKYLLEKRNIFQKLIKFANMENKVMMGISAGSIIMTPTIELAACADPNMPNLKTFDGFGLAQVLIKPHYQKWYGKEYMFRWFQGYYNSVHPNGKLKFVPIEDGECLYYGGKDKDMLMYYNVSNM